MSIVVVEGPDGSGKTTLIKNLKSVADRYFISLHNAGPPRNVLNVQCVTNWIEKIALGRVPLVCDRLSLISEPIYGEILRDENILEGSYTVDDMKSWLLDNVDRVIYCRPPTSVILEGIKKEDQLKGVASNISAITHKYDYTMKMLGHWGLHVTWYNWADEDCDPPYDYNELFFGEKK